MTKPKKKTKSKESADLVPAIDAGGSGETAAPNAKSKKPKAEKKADKRLKSHLNGFDMETLPSRFAAVLEKHPSQVRKFISDEQRIDYILANE